MPLLEAGFLPALCDDNRMAQGFEERALRVGPAQEFGPAARITRRAADRLRAGHLWVYRSDIDELIPGPGATDVPGGSLVSIVNSKGVDSKGVDSRASDAKGARSGLGTAIFSDASQIALRLVAPTVGVTRAGYLDLVRERVLAAVRLRAELAPEAPENNACRLIFSEADGLPGIVADRYNSLILLQLLTQGTAQEDVRQAVAETLADALPTVSTIVERGDPRVRELERLPSPPAEPLFVREGPQAAAATALTSVFTINGLRFHYDAAAGQKTGAFLDQRLNYAAAARYARGTALDVCTYQGGFALHLAQVCERVTGVDASLAALTVADRNLALNPGLGAEVDWIEADAFELLRAIEGSGSQYDTIVLDPPAFAKTKRAAEAALRGYKELNLRAIKLLRPGGTLVTCSCSHHVGLEEFTGVVASAASDAARRVQLLEVRGAAPDHPAILTLPETSYLKCLILRVE
jgi:23S rRNA (cytosine1962-C5)-methyltransferase